MKQFSLGAPCPKARTLMRVAVRTVTTVLVTACLLLAGLPAAAVEQVDDYVSLPFAHYGDMLVDTAHRQVFVTGGNGTNEIAVVALDGSGVTMIPGTPGASALSMTPDGRSVYASLVDADAVAEIDTATLATRRIPTGQASCPQDVAAVAGYVWFVEGGSDCNQWMEIRRLDPATGAVSADVMAGSLYSPVLRVVPGTTRFVYAETGISSSSVGVYDVADGTLKRTSGASLDGYLSRIVKLTNDGQHLMAYRSGSVGFYRTTDFAADGISVLPGGGWPGAYAADDDVVVMARRDSNRVEVLPRGASGLLNSIDLGPVGSDVADLELVGDQMFAVTEGATLRLYQVPRPAEPAPDLTLEVPAESVVGSPTTVSGRLSDQGAPVAGQVVTVRRDDGSPEPLGTSTTDADGRYSVELTPQETGSLAVTARSEGNATVKPATARGVLKVVGRPATLTLSGPESVEPGAPVTLTGSLSGSEGPLQGVSLRVERRCGGPSSSAQPLTTVETGSDKTFTVNDQPGSCGSYTYIARYDGSEVYAAGSATATIAVNWVNTWIDLGGPVSTHVGEPARVSGYLRTDEGPLPGTALVAQVATPDGPRDLGTVTTDNTGRFELTHTPETFGTYCYTVSFAGDSRRDPAEGRYCLSSYKLQTDLTLTGPFTARLDEPVILTGQLNSNGEPLAGAELLVSRSDSYRGTELLPSVVTGADGHFTIRDVPPEGGEVRYAVSFASTPTRSGASRTTLVTVGRPDRTLQLWTDRFTYAYGQTAQVVVDLATDSSRTVQVYAQEAGRGRVQIFSGEVPDAGLTLQYPMRRNTELSASVREDGRANAAYTAVSRMTRMAISTKALGSYGSAGRYALYRPSADPNFAAQVGPVRDRGCLLFQLQRRTAEGWRTVSQDSCPSIGEGSTASWKLTGYQAPRTPYRARPLFAGDDLNAATQGGWVYFKFVKIP